MAEDNDSPEKRSSSLDIIGRVWSSLTSNEEQVDSIESTNQNDDVENEKNTKNVASDVNKSEENVNDQPMQGIFSSILSSLGSEKDSEHTEVESASSSEDNNRTEDISVQKSDHDSCENLMENEEITDTPRHGSLALISDFFSSFSSASTTETTEDEVQTVEQSQNLDDKSNPDESDISSDSNTNDINEGQQDSFHSRVRSSSSALYTEPENIDKKDLDYVTLVSS